MWTAETGLVGVTDLMEMGRLGNKVSRLGQFPFRKVFRMGIDDSGGDKKREAGLHAATKCVTTTTPMSGMDVDDRDGNGGGDKPQGDGAAVEQSEYGWPIPSVITSSYVLHT